MFFRWVYVSSAPGKSSASFSSTKGKGKGTSAVEWKNEASVAFVVKGPTVACK